MKKSLCLILALTLCLCLPFVLASCGEEERDIYDLAADLAPTRTTTFVYFTAPNGDELNGEYVLETSGEDSIFSYTYHRYRTAEEAIAEGNSDEIKELTGKIYCKDGKYSSDGDTWGSAPVATDISLNLTPDKLTNAVISADGKTLTATVTPENAEAVLGTSLAADGDISLTVVSNGVYLTGITVVCKTIGGADVRVITSYSYNKLTLVFPKS